MSKESNIQGEGDYESARRYQEETEQFVKSGKMKRKTASIGQSDEVELGEAEKAGADRAKEEDPAVTRDYSKANK